MWTVALPLSVPVTKAKSFPLNLNVYRNAHYQTLDKAKKNFKAATAPLIRRLPRLDPVSITYTLFVRTKRAPDVANVCSIVDKFFCDALVELGRLPNDDPENVVSVCYRFGGVDRSNPRVEATIEPIGSTTHEPDLKEKPVKISLVQTEIEAAVEAHIRSMINVRDGMKVTMDFSATRGADGLTAAIDIVPDTDPNVRPAPAATTTARQISSQPEARTEAPTQPAQTQRAPSVFKRTAATPAPAAQSEPDEPYQVSDVDADGLNEDEEREALSQPGPGTSADQADASGEEEVNQAPKASIFSGLKRPTNPKPALEAAE